MNNDETNVANNDATQANIWKRNIENIGKHASWGGAGPESGTMHDPRVMDGGTTYIDDKSVERSHLLPARDAFVKVTCIST